MSLISQLGLSTETQEDALRELMAALGKLGELKKSKATRLLVDREDAIYQRYGAAADAIKKFLELEAVPIETNDRGRLTRTDVTGRNDAEVTA